jgi:lauroyl/myristoyl acyltransferase
MCGHFGNWEWSNLAAGFRGVSPVTVGENFKNPRLTAIFKALREQAGGTLIPQDNSLFRMLKTVKRGGVVALVIDLNLPPSQATTIVESFRDPETGEGFKMSVPILHAVLAQRAGAKLVLGETHPRRDGSARVTVFPPVDVLPEDSLSTIAQKCWDVLEKGIREHPELYLWSYKHFRYRPRKTGREYPYYSNESGKFEKLLREVEKQQTEGRA